MDNRLKCAVMVCFLSCSSAFSLDDIWDAGMQLFDSDDVQKTIRSELDEEPAEDFQCERAGVYNSSCTRYHVCSINETSNLVQQDFECPEGMAFNNEYYCDLPSNVPGCEHLDTAKLNRPKRDGLEEECRKGGMICANCTHYFFCNEMMSGDFQPSETFACPVDAGHQMFCDPKKGLCLQYDQVPGCHEHAENE